MKKHFANCLKAIIHGCFDLPLRTFSLTVFFELKNALNRTNECCVEFEINTDRGSLDLDAEAVH